MVKVYTAQYRYPGENRLDITVKGKDPVGRTFAPTWPIVMAHKKNKDDWKYIQAFHDIMIANYDSDTAIWEEVLARDTVVLVCFCPAGAFCHRNLVAQYLVQLGAEFCGELVETNNWEVIPVEDVVEE